LSLGVGFAVIWVTASDMLIPEIAVNQWRTDASSWTKSFCRKKKKFNGHSRGDRLIYKLSLEMSLSGHHASGLDT
jgi:hypothetical protein